MAVVDGKIKETLTHQKVSNAAENLRVIPLAEFWEENTDCLHALALQRTGDHAGLVIELFGGRFDAGTGRIWNGAARRIVQNIGDGRWAEV